MVAKWLLAKIAATAAAQPVTNAPAPVAQPARVSDTKPKSSAARVAKHKAANLEAVRQRNREAKRAVRAKITK